MYGETVEEIFNCILGGISNGILGGISEDSHQQVLNQHTYQRAWTHTLNSITVDENSLNQNRKQQGHEASKTFF